MPDKKLVLFTVALIVASLTWFSHSSIPSATAVENYSITVPSDTIPEGNDFATRVLRDPWDMSELTDVSQYLNESGQRHLVKNIQIADGVFSGTSVGDVTNGNAYFLPLFPGYETAIHTGRAGSRYPIDSNTYKCLYMAMRVESGAANGFGPDQYRVFWFADDRLTGGPWGVSKGIPLYPEAGANQPTHYWNLYRINLASPENGHNGDGWNSSSTWQGLRIDPTINADVSFQVDWVRLTPCDASTVPITFSSNSSITSVWVRPADSSRHIRVANDVDGSSGRYDLDVQGLPAGTYYVGLGTTTSCCQDESTKPITVNTTPIATFQNPSFTTPNEDIVAWEFTDASDVEQIANTQGSVQDGMLDLVTESGPLPGGHDARVELNVRQPIDTQQHNVLTFRMHTEWKVPWQNVPHGMITRLIWSVEGGNNSPCYMVSQDMPFDIGWQTYTIDLTDGFAGQAEESSGSCGGIPTHWSQLDRPVVGLRFDPNENITEAADNVSGGGPFYQKVDWIRLTSVDTVPQGTPFQVQASFNKSPSQLDSIKLYYTTDPDGDPHQHPAARTAAGTPRSAAAAQNSIVYMPILMNYHTSVPNGVTLTWNTDSVAPGLYYLCIEADDGYNVATSCSTAPVRITAN